MHKLIGSLFVAWALLRNIGVAPPELPQCIPPPPLEEALLPDGTEPALPSSNFVPNIDFIEEQEAAAAEVREKFPSYPESVLQQEIISPEPTPTSYYRDSPEIIYFDPNIPWSYSVQVAPRPTYYNPIYNCTTSS